MYPEAIEELRIRHIKFVLEYGKQFGATHAIRTLKQSRGSFYQWKKLYEDRGEEALRRKKPIAHSHPNTTPQETIDLILSLRTRYHLGPERISMYLQRFHGISCSESTVYRTLAKHGINCLSKFAPKRSIHSRRYAKVEPGHHVQVDVKFIMIKDLSGRNVRRFQYTAIDDATRIRALRMYTKHNQNCAIEFINYVVDKFPFRIHTIRTDRGHEFQARFHWHVEDLGMSHVYIKPKSPQLNGKVERSHRTDQMEFYQLLTYTDDVDLNDKLKAWENFYNFDRPHLGLHGMTPYEVLKLKMSMTC